MKLRITYPELKNSPVVEIEDVPDRCAELIRSLGQGHVAEVSATREFERPASPKGEGQALLPGVGARQNRRALVLEAMRNLRSSGVNAPTLKQIKARFEVLFPEASLQNLDQVVRDLANKTELLVKAGRGSFTLAD